MLENAKVTRSLKLQELRGYFQVISSVCSRQSSLKILKKKIQELENKRDNFVKEHFKYSNNEADEEAKQIAADEYVKAEVEYDDSYDAIAEKIEAIELLELACRTKVEVEKDNDGDKSDDTKFEVPVDHVPSPAAAAEEPPNASLNSEPEDDSDADNAEDTTKGLTSCPLPLSKLYWLLFERMIQSVLLLVLFLKKCTIKVKCYMRMVPIEKRIWMWVVQNPTNKMKPTKLHARHPMRMKMAKKRIRTTKFRSKQRSSMIREVTPGSCS